MNNLPLTNQCFKCKQWFHSVHACPQDFALMPTNCPTAAGCKVHGCHGACLEGNGEPAIASHPTAAPAGVSEAYVDALISKHLGSGTRDNIRQLVRAALAQPAGEVPDTDDPVLLKLFLRRNIAERQRLEGLLATQSTTPQAQPVGEVVGHHKVGFGEMPTIRWEGSYWPPVGTKLYAACPSEQAHEQ